MSVVLRWRVALRALAGALLVGALFLPSAVGAAAPAFAPSAEPKPGKQLCRITDERLAEVSGLVATESGYVALPDGNPDRQQVVEVFDLDAECQVVERHSFQRYPYDPEDLAISPDGTLWIADIGDNGLARDSAALWEISPDRNTATLYRMAYPDGKHDAEALLMQPNGVPVIVTKDLNGGGVAGLYQPTEELVPDQTVPTKRVGEVKLTNTGTGGGPVGAVGQKLVTGAALSADGKRAVLRTYTDAYEWQVSGGDVVAALAKGKPVRTPLPGEPQGEAITISLDGKRFITASEAAGGQSARMYSYVPNRPEPHKKPVAKGGGSGWFDSLGLQLQDIKLIIAGLGVIGLVMVVLGIWGIRRARYGPTGGEGDNKSPDDPRRPDGGSGRARLPERERRGPGRPRPADPERRGRGRLRADAPPRRGDSAAMPGRAAGRATVAGPRGPVTGVARPPAQARAVVPGNVPHQRSEPRSQRAVNRPDPPHPDEPHGGRYW